MQKEIKNLERKEKMWKVVDKIYPAIKIVSVAVLAITAIAGLSLLSLPLIALSSVLAVGAFSIFEFEYKPKLKISHYKNCRESLQNKDEQVQKGLDIKLETNKSNAKTKKVVADKTKTLQNSEELEA